MSNHNKWLNGKNFYIMKFYNKLITWERNVGASIFQLKSNLKKDGIFQRLFAHPLKKMIYE